MLASYSKKSKELPFSEELEIEDLVLPDYEEVNEEVRTKDREVRVEE